MNWKVGDRAVCIMPGKWHMMECTVMSELRPKRQDGPTIPIGTPIHETDLPTGHGRVVVALPSELKPIYDGNQKTSWEDCIWEPQTVTIDV